MKRILIAGGCDKRETRLLNSYLAAVFASGGLPAVAIAADEKQAQAYAEAFDALLLPGGNDVNPELFGQKRNVSCTYVDPVHDLSDRLLWEAFHAAGRRVLGICRGMQAVNVFCGGTLLQHLPEAYGERPLLWHAGLIWGRHAVRVEEGTMLAAAFGAGERRCNSSHHQAVDRIGTGLCATAFAPDGVVEALEGENTLLVQFHPERMGQEGAGLFAWLLG